MCCFDNICVYHSYSCFEGCFILKGRRRVFNLRWLQLKLDGIVSFTTFCNLLETIPFLLWGLLRERDSLLQKIDGFIYGRKDKVIILWQNIIGNSKALCFSIPSSYQAWICWFVCLFNFVWFFLHLHLTKKKIYLHWDTCLRTCSLAATAVPFEKAQPTSTSGPLCSLSPSLASLSKGFSVSLSTRNFLTWTIFMGLRDRLSNRLGNAA